MVIARPPIVGKANISLAYKRFSGVRGRSCVVCPFPFSMIPHTASPYGEGIYTNMWASGALAHLRGLIIATSNAPGTPFSPEDLRDGITHRECAIHIWIPVSEFYQSCRVVSQTCNLVPSHLILKWPSQGLAPDPKSAILRLTCSQGAARP